MIDISEAEGNNFALWSNSWVFFSDIYFVLSLYYIARSIKSLLINITSNSSSKIGRGEKSTQNVKYLISKRMNFKMFYFLKFK